MQDVGELIRRLAARYGVTVLARARAPVLLLIAAGLFLFDLIVPDFIPFVDEILLAVVTILLARWRVTGAGPKA